MGVCINYSGKLKSVKKIYQFIEEIEDIAKIMDWKYTILDEDWTKECDVKFVNDPVTKELEIVGNAYLKGIIITPPNCESMQFLFDNKGNLTDFVQIAMQNSFKKHKPPKQWTKTQFAGAEIHITLIKLLKYLKKTYIPNLSVYDEGGYWETENREELENNMGIINTGIEIITSIAESSGTMDDFLNKLDKWIEKKS